MSDERSPRLALPLLQPGQAQKENDHNEALALLDIATQASVLAVAVNAPPADPVPGDCWIVGPSPVGAWAEHAAALAAWTSGGWRFLTPQPGMTVWSVPDSLPVRYEAGGWRSGDIRGARLMIEGKQVIGPQAAAIPDPTGGVVIDAQARDALNTILATLREHGIIEV
ncbi:DUF2793 domain-containing protein [Sphingomonas sp. TX0543]|uniref:DUF2793 domain-containing protein n=1 Tax=unclassified Sphingomonas TaxID=196159 RepID=UPI0010F82178|nr:DUF2793 domain-containing protein [Sphingomonas sp. 3P27F8]